MRAAFYLRRLGVNEMSVTLIVTTSHDEDFNQTDEEILEEEWEEYVESQDNLRFRTESHVATNPATGETIKMAAREGETEVLIEDSWNPFLCHYSGELQMRYRQELEDSNNPIRHAIVEVADYFSALITHDADDEILKW